MKFLALTTLLVIIVSIGFVKAEEEGQSSAFGPLRRLIVDQVSRLGRLAPQMNQPAESVNQQSERSMYSSYRLMDSINKGIANDYKKFKGAGSWV